MGPIKAVGRAYGQMFNFSGRARRAEYWWFVLFQVLLTYAVIGGYIYWGVQAGRADPAFAAMIEQSGGFGTYTERLVSENMIAIFAVYLIVSFIPSLSALIRRLHDTDRSGFWYFITLVPLIGGIWLLVLLVLPGTHGSNRFGGDSVANRKAREPSHPAFAKAVEGPDRERLEQGRKAAAHDYYKRHVLPSVQKGPEGA